MRRAALTAASGLLLTSGIAAAEPWTLTMEAGAEADSNVQRVESDDAATPPIAAGVGLAGARVDHKDHLLGGSYVLGASGLARMVTSANAKDENVMLAAADARWIHPLDGQPIAAGFGITTADAFALTGGIGARTFRNLGADGLLSLGNDDRRLTFAVGGRDFVYKPDTTFNWRGLSATARLDILLWQAPEKTRSFELLATLGFEGRDYQSTALMDNCPVNSVCAGQPTSLLRHDRYERANLEFDYSGSVVVTAGYQLTVIDSNSYGQSLVRHRIIGSATTELADKLFGTVTATLQLDQYPDGLLTAAEIQRQQLTSLEDENRSSLQVRIAQQLSAAWSLELRGAIWHDFGNSAGAFHRELIYTGAIYSY
jgi:hypothetical protein